MAEKEQVTVTGLEMSADRKDAEYDLVKSLLAAMDYQKEEENITEVEIRRNGKFYFSVHLHPISDEQIRTARKKSTVYVPNPNNKKLPPIEKELNSVRMKSMAIYLATTEEDQQKIWGNPAVKEKAGLMENYESVDVLLNAGEKLKLWETVLDISGLNDDDDDTMDEEEYSKN